jgi:CDP-4-dehydro-6-deoxyglucose reductase
MTMSYRVTVPSVGKSYEAKPDESILQALLRQGLTPAYACGNGSCKTCCSRLIEGEIHYPLNPPLALSRSERQSGLILICQARAASDVVVQPQLKVSLSEQVRQHEIRLATSHLRIRRIRARVEKLERLCHDVMLVGLRPDEPLTYLAGQYVNFLTPFGTRRDFSITNAPGKADCLEFHIRHVPGGQFTDYIFSRMRVGETLEIEGPLGTFFARESSHRPILMLAGGTGFGPIKSILERLLPSKQPPVIHLYWGARARRDLYLHDLALGWQRAYERFTYTPVLSEPRDDEEQEFRRGFVHEALAADHADLSDYDVYMAGPPVMIERAIERFSRQALRVDRLFHDSFAFAQDTGGAQE